MRAPLEATSALPAAAIVAGLFILAALVGRHVPFFRRELDHDAQLDGRALPLDGLRGLLAYAVFLHHGVIWSFYINSGYRSWTVPPSNLYAMLGAGAVATFFMITGFLFWSKIFQSEGKLDAGRFISSRIRRIVPAYLLSVAAVLTIVAVRTWGQPWEPAPRLLNEVACWLSFGLLGMPPINGLRDTRHIVASVYWTLAYEWVFYLVVPLFTVFRRLRWFVLFNVLGYYYFNRVMNNEPVRFFIWGGLCAYLARHREIRAWLTSPLGTVISAGALIGALTLVGTAYSAEGTSLLFLFFLPIALGNTLFGLLTSRPLRLLGYLSYGVYLYHGIVLSLFLQGTIHIAPPALWMKLAFAAPAVFLAAALSYRFVEWPWLKRGGAALRPETARPSAAGALEPMTSPRVV
jgi:peptidoglycan/LPS O-acetylase OafA/YrhL